MVYLFVIVLIAIIVTIILNCTYKKSTHYKNTLIDFESIYKEKKHNAKIALLGSTYSEFAFGYFQLTNCNVLDLTNQAHSLDMDYAFLKKYKAYLEIDGIIFITLGACCMLYRGNNNPLYNLFLKPSEMPRFSIKSKFESLFPLVFHPKRIKYLLNHVVPYNTFYDTMQISSGEDCSTKTLLDLANGWINMFGLRDLKSTEFSHENEVNISYNTKILKEIIDLCIDNQLNPVIVIPPFSSRLNDYFSKEFTDSVLKNSVDRAIGDRKIPVMDYQWDTFFQDEYTLFADGGFRLNLYGSEIFIKRLLGDLSLVGYNINNSVLIKR